MEHVNVIILTPGHSMMSIYVRSLLATTQMLNQKGISWAFASEYSSHVADARELTLNGDNRNSYVENRPFKGEVSYDKLFWIDSDIAWAPEDFLKLYESDKDIISGAYLLASGEVTAYKKMLSPGYTFEDVLAMDEPVQVEGSGFGFMCVGQGVFESLSRPWFQAAKIHAENPETGVVEDLAILGEDLSWCQRVRDNGFEIWFDPTVRVQHHKMMKLTWEGIRP